MAMVFLFWSMMTKKALLLLAAVFLFFQTAGLYKTIAAAAPGTWEGGLAWLMAAALNLFATGIWAMAGFALPTSRLLPQSYYAVHHPERLKKWFRWLGVSFFQKALLRTFWGKENNRKRYFNGNRGGIEHFVFQTKQSEFGHLGAFFTILVFSALFITQQHWQLAGFTTMINLVFNLYPIILQRHHRLNVQRILRLQSAVESRMRQQG
jgi:hypothetical protein